MELNEAFASQVLASMRELGFDHERLNVNGGAIALGHPLGASGARLLGTLAWELRRRGARYGVATMCIGVGQGLAAVIENPAAGLARSDRTSQPRRATSREELQPPAGAGSGWADAGPTRIGGWMMKAP